MNKMNKRSVNFAKYFANLPTLSKKVLLPTKDHTQKKRPINTRIHLNFSHYIVPIEKTELRELVPIGQFDKKFIVTFRPKDSSIILFDQHAIHERILYEFYTELLLETLFGEEKSTKENKSIVKLNLFTDIFSKETLKHIIRINAEEFEIDLTEFKENFEVQGLTKHNILNFTFAIEGDYILFYTFPIIFDKLHKVQKLISIFKDLINNIELTLRNFNDNHSQIVNLFDSFIRSKACRNAIKFNDEIDKEFLVELIKALSECKNPFICAHGRHNFFLISQSKGE